MTSTVPLWSVARPLRETVDPESLGADVLHYSIPVLEAMGSPQVEASETIKSQKLRLRGGELLISKLNPRKSRVLVVPRVTQPTVASTEFVAFAPFAAEPRFLAYVLLSESTRQLLDANVRSVTRSHQRVEPDVVARVPIPDLPIDDQRRIADFLDTETARLDRLVKLRRSQRDLVAERAVEEVAQVVDQQVALHGVLPLRRSAVAIQQGWSPVCDDVEAEPDEWAVLKTSAVSGGRFDPREHKRLPSGVEPDHRCVVMPGDLLLTRGSGSPHLVGVAAVAEPGSRRLLISDLLYRVSMSQGASTQLVAAYLRSRPIRDQVALLMRGQSGQTIKLRSEDVRAIPIPATPLANQAAVFDEIHAIEAHAADFDEASTAFEVLLLERRQALITAAVRGRLDVTMAPRTTESL